MTIRLKSAKVEDLIGATIVKVTVYHDALEIVAVKGNKRYFLGAYIDEMMESGDTYLDVFVGEKTGNFSPDTPVPSGWGRGKTVTEVRVWGEVGNRW